MSPALGRCPVCGVTVEVRPNGTVARHTADRVLPWLPTRVCPGEGLTPLPAAGPFRA